MRLLIIVLLSLHALSGVFWAGATFILARNAGAGADTMLPPMRAAAIVVFLTGVGLWVLLHGLRLGGPEVTLLVGIVAAVLAAGVQDAMQRKPALAHRIAAGLLALTIICMVSARLVG